MAICGRFRSPRWGLLGWAFALALAFASHFVLDSIPHMDAIGPLQGFRYSVWLFLAFGLLGGGMAVFLYIRNREAALIWILLSVWIGIAGLAGTMVRGLAALALIGLLAYRTRRAEAPAYLVAGMLAVSGDLVPGPLRLLQNFHDGMHFMVGWGTSLFLRFQSSPIPSGAAARLQNPYFLLGYGLELAVEAAILLAAFLSFSRLALERKVETESAASVPEPEETRAPV